MPDKPKVLLVEDDALIALELGERVSDLGYEVVGPAATIGAAEQAVAEALPDIALLDANLLGVSTVELGVSLRARGVRIAFCTGYDQIKGLPPEMAGTPVLTKPIGDDDLKTVLQRLSA